MAGSVFTRDRFVEGAGACKPNISEDLRRALEKCGTETIRTILFHGWANREDLPEAIQGIAKPSGHPGSERKNAIAWLEWKEAHQARRDKVTVIAAVLAAIFSFIALFK
jgi:hypothetical protein